MRTQTATMGVKSVRPDHVQHNARWRLVRSAKPLAKASAVVIWPAGGSVSNHPQQRNAAALARISDLAIKSADRWFVLRGEAHSPEIVQGTIHKPPGKEIMVPRAMAMYTRHSGQGEYAAGSPARRPPGGRFMRSVARFRTSFYRAGTALQSSGRV